MPDLATYLLAFMIPDARWARGRATCGRTAARGGLDLDTRMPVYTAEQFIMGRGLRVSLSCIAPPVGGNLLVTLRHGHASARQILSDMGESLINF